MITHVLDSSAVLAHYLQEPGATDVHAILSQQNSVGLCVVSLPEIKIRLRELVKDPAEVERVYTLYTTQLTNLLDVTKEVAQAATTLRETIRPRLPTVDALIAGCAKVNEAILVHRDPHMSAIPTSEVKQLLLPPKSVGPGIL
jgi:predicted nucleic acid-binding protein